MKGVNMLFWEKLQACDFDIKCLKDSRILITGATGLIGKAIALNLVELSERFDCGIQLILVVRDKEKLDSKLKNLIGVNVFVCECDMVDFSWVEFSVDYIIHCASITSSRLMVDSPVEVILTNVLGTNNILNFAKKVSAKSVVYLSSMEVYGFTSVEVKLKEDDLQYLNPIALRSSYPESKRMAENLCVAFNSEYGVPTKIVRLAQTFGKGVAYDDSRVFGEFARCAVQGKDIVLFTDGTSKRMYLDIEDAVTGILVVLFKGENGCAYNIANKETYCSITEMANLVADTICNNKINVKHQLDANKASCFSPAHKFNLDVDKIERLGWRACTNLVNMYKEMIEQWVIS